MRPYVKLHFRILDLAAALNNKQPEVAMKAGVDYRLDTFRCDTVNGYT